MAGATRLQENDLAAAVEEIRRTPGAAALDDAELAALFAKETQRVTEATLTAEIMIHRLTEIWPPPAFSPPRPEAPASRESAASRPALAGPPAISDLLDAMLALERTSTRPTPNR